MKKDIQGKVYSRLTVIREAKKKRRGTAMIRTWLCQCECGEKPIVAQVDLYTGDTKSCGCLKKEKSKFPPSWKHGFANWKGKRPKEYTAWKNMRKRCGAIAGKDAPYYKRIKVCKRWDSFIHFLKDMGYAPSPDHSVDRINSKLGYTPSNCRWATIEQQSRNRSNVKTYSYNGKKMASWELAKIAKTTRGRMHSFLKRYNGDVNMALEKSRKNIN